MSDRKKFYLFAGQFLITTVPAEIVTVLGSCVSVCLWDKQKKIGGMNHFLLPGTDSDDAGNSNRGNTSIRMLVRSMINRHSKIEDLEAKVFGGCNSLYTNANPYSIGKRNIEMAMSILHEQNIHVTASHTGGEFGRKIIFNTRTGKVRMRLLTKTAAELNEEIHKGFGL